MAGQVGASYLATLGISRFANAKMQAAVDKAKVKALYDPDTATAILELAATPSTQPLGLSTVQKLFRGINIGNGQSLVDRLIERGLVSSNIGRGALYGAEQAKQRDQLPVFGKAQNLQ